MMPLDDLHVKAGAERGLCVADQLHLQIDAEGHVPGLEYGHLFSGVRDETHVPFGQAGGADDGGRVPRARKTQYVR